MGEGFKAQEKRTVYRPFLQLKSCILKPEKVECDDLMLPRKSCPNLFSLSTCVNIYYLGCHVYSISSNVNNDTGILHSVNHDAKSDI